MKNGLINWKVGKDTKMETIPDLVSDIMNQLGLSVNYYRWARIHVNNTMEFHMWTNRELMGIPISVKFPKMRVIIQVSHPSGSDPIVFLVENTLLKTHALNQLMDFIADNGNTFAQP